MPGAEEVRQHHDADQVAGVQTGRTGVEPLVQGDGAALECAPQRRFVGDLGHEAALAQLVQHVGRARDGHWTGFYEQIAKIVWRSASEKMALGSMACTPRV